jgi:hypothetical protein
MKPMHFILIIAVVIAYLVLLSRIVNMTQEPQQQEEQQELPQGAIGTSKNGGYIYRADFIGPLNKNDVRAE